MDYALSHSFSPCFMLIPIIKQRGYVVMSEGIALAHTHKQNLSGRNVQGVSMMRLRLTFYA